MAIKEEFIKVCKTKHKEYYESIGYLFNEDGVCFIKSTDLKRSNYNITAICDICLEERKVPLNYYSSKCKKCKNITIRTTKDEINYNLIIDKIIKIKWSPSTRSHYESFGYIFTKIGNEFEVDIKHVQKCSNIKVNAKCIDCEIVRQIKLNDFKTICSLCRMKKLNSNRTTESRRVSSKKAWDSSSEQYKLSVINRLRSFKGEFASNWRSERTINERLSDRNSIYTIEWAKKVKNRDNYTCQVCFDNRGGNLVSHHLMSWKHYPELRQDLNNGVCLCVDCHKKFHKYYGIKHVTKDMFYEFKKIVEFEVYIK